MAHSEDYERVSASYECSFLKPTKEFKSTDDVIQLHGGYLNYAHGFQLRERTFLETGIGISALTGNAEPMMDTDGNVLNQKITNCYLKVPVNLAYRLPLDDKFSLSLFAGIAGKCNLYYKSKVSAGNSAIPGLDVDGGSGDGGRLLPGCGLEYDRKAVGRGFYVPAGTARRRGGMSGAPDSG